jgi:predicted ATPase/DNA-binding XRE family transcriptional regulator
MQQEISFGEWLRKQRRSLDLSRQAFAAQVGCAEVTLRRIEAGTLKPSKELASLLLEKLAIPEIERSQWISFARGLSGFPTQSISTSNKPITNLPAPLTTFIGREKVQSEITQLISEHRLVTLTGAGGVGKTRLAIKIGKQILENYADGVWLVELAPILDPDLVPRTIAIAIGLRDEPQRPVIDMLSDYLRGKKMFIILDNCEHLLDACAQLADIMLKRCPGLKILGTSRETLGILGESVYPVSSLELPDLKELIDRFRDYESVRLFEERAQLARMDFSLTLENASSVAKICTHLDGIPLGIELAAARIGTFSTEQIADRLQDSFNLLTTGNRTALPRHQTLRAAIDWSYDLLSQAEQTLFRRLSVFVNGWTLEAAESICADDNMKSDTISDLLAQLINKSLVITQEQERQTRYRMLETIRQYANEKLIDAGENEKLRDRHLEYFLNLALAAEPYLIRTEQIEWLPRLDADHENLRFAFEWSLDKQTAESSLNLCKALWWFWKIRCYWLEGRNWVRRALSKPFQQEGHNGKIARARALYTHANLEWQLGDFEQMLPPAQASFELAQEVSDKRVIAIARYHLGAVLFRNDLEKGSLFIQQSFAEFQSLNEAFWQAISFPFVSEILMGQGKLTNNAGALKSLELARKTGERLLIADALSSYASWLFLLDRTDEGKDLIKEAERLYIQIGYQGPTDNTSLLAVDAWMSGDIQKARMILTQMHQHYSRLGEKIYNAHCVFMLGVLTMEEGDLHEAQVYLEQALVLSRESGQKADRAFFLIGLGNLFYLQGNLEAFKQSAKEGLSFRNLLGKVQKVHLLVDILHSLHLQNPQSSVRILSSINNAKSKDEILLGRFATRDYGRYESYLRQQLGDTTFNSAFTGGRKMSLDEGLDLVSKIIEEV